MPVISVNSDDLLELTGSDQVTLLEVLPKIGIEVEEIKGESWELEVKPDRCDMLSVEGIARTLRGFLGDETGLPDYETSSSDIKTEVELSVQDVRPYIVTALVKNVDLTTRALKSLMDLQEKLHLTIGRNRSKVAIGLHDFEPVEPPITYKAVKPEEVSFVPLERSIEMDLQEILERHDKGKEFVHILKDKERYPVILDSNDNVLSFPPIINGQLTEVTPETDTFFIDMTGTDMEALAQTLNIFCTTLAERDADIYTTEVSYGSRNIEYPDFTPDTIEFSADECEDILGTQISKEEIENILERMRYSAEKKEDGFEVKIPPYRHDIIHPWDVIEDVAIGYDYDEFEGTLPEEVTIGEALPETELKEAVTELMLGYGFNEVMNYILTNPEREFDKMDRKKKEDIAVVENPVSEKRTSLRTGLLPALLSNLRENRTESLPQKLFEIGDSVIKGEQETRFAGVIESSKVGFTEMKSLVGGLLTSLGEKMAVEPKKHDSFIEGRCASVIVDGEELGFFGEVSPEVLENFELENPVGGFELDFEKLYSLKES
ncbi:MAG: phenylalanine--tRNA ligase subunit beta [Candidatus Thermoplasmatota archaeon]|nr:phenylalanine--tRNA ligase subunit beta [Candidatus Thermoplasmatota archaeon]